MRGLARATLRGSTLATLLLCFFVYLGGARAIRSASRSVGVDYYQFWAIGRDVVQHEHRSVYGQSASLRLGQRLAGEAARSDDVVLRTAGAWRGSLSATGTPLHYAAVGYLSSSDYVTSLKTYRCALLCGFCASVLGLGWLFGLSLSNSLATLSLLLLVQFEPLLSDLRVGNVNCIQLAGLAFYAWIRQRSPVRQREVVAAAWLGLLLAFKPNLILVAAILSLQPLLHRNVHTFLRTTAALLAGAAFAMLLASFAWQSPVVWLDWFKANATELAGWATVGQGNYAPLALLLHYSPAVSLLGFGCSLLAVVALGVCLRDPVRPAETAVTTSSECAWFLAIGCLAPLLITHLAWLHYFVLTTPALLLVTSRPRQTPRSLRQLGRLALVIAAWVLLAGASFKFSMSATSDLESAVVHVLGVLVLLCSLCAESRTVGSQPLAPLRALRVRRKRGRFATLPVKVKRSLASGRRANA